VESNHTNWQMFLWRGTKVAPRIVIFAPAGHDNLTADQHSPPAVTVFID